MCTTLHFIRRTIWRRNRARRWRQRRPRCRWVPEVPYCCKITTSLRIWLISIGREFLNVSYMPRCESICTYTAKTLSPSDISGPLPEATPTESDRRILLDLVGFCRIWSDSVGFWFLVNSSYFVVFSHILSDLVGFGRIGWIRTNSFGVAPGRGPLQRHCWTFQRKPPRGWHKSYFS